MFEKFSARWELVMCGRGQGRNLVGKRDVVWWKAARVLCPRKCQQLVTAMVLKKSVINLLRRLGHKRPQGNATSTPVLAAMVTTVGVVTQNWMEV